ncbi:hypothetical protein F3F96_04775 [Mariprofundus sp. NF]|uniref:tetratricopeptide repeat protein n=1 Tax=Mariprofundus sp. NF TaxID=2608716 RepID=UPI00159FF97C|nr:hypothetical protein [Mariprofundus sp. NF]NWF38442.1 hypothetical protein [Mariprofundus sp. NF]
MKIIGLVALSCLLTACGAMGHVQTNDPLVKTQQAYSLMSQDRFLMAEDYLFSAQRILEENPNPAVEADVHFTLGNLYKNEGYHRHKVQFEKLGTYDGTYMKSVKHFRKAKELFNGVGSDVGVAKSLLGLGSAYGLGGDKKKGCEAQRSALDVYNSAKSEGRITSEPGLINSEPIIYNPNYKTLGEMAMAMICSSCMQQPWTTKEACFSHFKK